MVSFVIPSYNSDKYIFETIDSIRAQTYPDIEIILVNDGTNRPQSLRILERASRLVDRYIEQENHGLGGARNAGFRAACTEWVVPLDSDDLIRPEYVEECMHGLEAKPSAAFAYTGMEIFGRETSIDPGFDYNLHYLLYQNHVTCAALIRKQDWELVGGYDETGRCSGYEDWEFWLNLGAHSRFGVLVPKPLFRYRKHGPSLYDDALVNHQKLVAYIREKHPELYACENLARIKARWMPVVCLAGPLPAQTIEDVQTVADVGDAARSQTCNASAFLLASPRGADLHSAELAALAVWGGKEALQLPDGSMALSRQAAAGGKVPAGAHKKEDARWSGGRRLRQHFVHAELNSWDAWLRHPGRSVLRLIPLRVKERINQAAGRPVFDLTFYLQFQPRAVLVGDSIVDPLRYMPKPATRRRIALVTPHLGPGGAESVLLEIADALDRERFELLVLATQSRDNRWLHRWRAASEHVYDLAPLVPPERMSAAVYSIVTNWRCGAILVQNSLFGYAALPQVRQDAPDTLIVDLVHAVDSGWDQVAATARVGPAIDLRIAISDAVAGHLWRAGIAPERIRLIRNGVDLSRFCPRPRPAVGVGRILFAGRLDPVKRPLLLVDIARRLAALRKARDFRFVVAGDGPELAALQAKVRRHRLQDVFEFAGYVQEMPPLFAACDVLLLTSRVEGVPLVVLEALASGRPVVASKAGAIAEAVDPDCGMLIEIAEGEAARFAAALHRILDDRDLRESMGAAGRRKAEAGFDRTVARAAYRQLFE